MAAALLLAVAVPGAASADAPPPSSVRTAYWWVPEPVTGLIPAPGVPADGLYVASSPGGTQAMSALSLTGPIRSGVVKLTLRVAQRQVINPPAITAYAVTSSWQAGGPQPWSSRPRYGTALADGVYDAEQTHMSMRLPAVALSRGIVLVPSTTEGASLSPTFAMSFQPPIATAVRPSTAPTSRAGHRHTPSPSGSPERSHSPGSSTPTSSPTRHNRPSATPRPRHTAQPATPTPPPSFSSPAPTSVAVTDSTGPSGLMVGVVLAAVLIAAVGLTMSWRLLRRPPPPD